MFALLLFQRYGIAVPILVFVSTLLMETVLDAHYGPGYYSRHAWVTGVALVFSGGALAALVWAIAPPSDMEPARYGLLRDVELGQYYDHTETTKAKLKNFVLQPSGTDHFCYFPLNWCALVLLGVGALLVVYGALWQ